MKINGIFNRKESSYEPKECVIEFIEIMTSTQFNYFNHNLLADYPFIIRHQNEMFHDESGTLHAILALNEETGDGIIIDSSGYAYPRNTSYVPCIKPYLDNQIAMICDRVLSEAVFNNKMEFDLTEVSEQYGVPLREGNGFGAMFAEQMQNASDVKRIEFEDGMFEITLDSNEYTTHRMEMEGF